MLLTSNIRQTQDVNQSYAQWLKQLREVCQACGIPLIFDEVYTGFQDFVPPEGNPNLGNPHTIAGGSQRRYQFGVRYGF